MPWSFWNLPDLAVYWDGSCAHAFAENRGSFPGSQQEHPISFSVLCECDGSSSFSTKQQLSSPKNASSTHLYTAGWPWSQAQIKSSFLGRRDGLWGREHNRGFRLSLTLWLLATWIPMEAGRPRSWVESVERDNGLERAPPRLRRVHLCCSQVGHCALWFIMHASQQLKSSASCPDPDKWRKHRQPSASVTEPRVRG